MDFDTGTQRRRDDLFQRHVVHAQLDGYEGERHAFSRNWHYTIPRDHM